jgi:hypothetical protein
MLRQVLYHLSHSTSPFCSGYFWDRVCIYSWASVDLNHPIYASRAAVMAGTHHHTQILLVEMESHELFAQTVLKPTSS